MYLNVLKNIARAVTCALFLAVISPVAATAQSVSTTASVDVMVYPAATPLKVWVVLTKTATDRPTRIDLLDANNQTLARTVLPKKEDRVRQLFDLSAMSDGVYKFRVVTGKDVVLKTVELKTAVAPEPLPTRAITLTVDDNVVAGL